jgi:hypothetical protein
MAERTNIPSSPACGQWETLLADALDGLLRPEDEATFSAHMAVCPACTALFDEARRGREWLEFLSPEPEVPLGLLDKILAQTGPGQVEGYGLATAGSDVIPMRPGLTPAWQRPGFVGNVRRFAEPRLLMTAAMAFFSLSLTLYLTGFRLSSVRLADLRPTAVRSFMERRLTMASTPIIRYYDHSRLVYAVQSRMRDLHRAAEDVRQDEENQRKQQDQAPGESKQAPERLRQEPAEQSATPVMGPAEEPTFNDSEFLVTSLTFQNRPALSGGSQTELRERSIVWIA